jgi:hypothetical protein
MPKRDNGRGPEDPIVFVSPEPPRRRRGLLSKMKTILGGDVSSEEPTLLGAPKESSAVRPSTLAEHEGILRTLEEAPRMLDTAEQDEVRAVRARLQPDIAEAEAQEISASFGPEVPYLQRIAGLNAQDLRSKGYSYQLVQQAVDKAQSALNFIGSAPGRLENAKDKLDGLTAEQLKLGMEKTIKEELRFYAGERRTIAEYIGTVKFLMSEIERRKPQPVVTVKVQRGESALHQDRPIIDFDPMAS